MTKEDIKKFMPLMQAMLEGKTIQCYCELNKDWIDIDEIFIGNKVSNYRIKPEDTPSYSISEYHFEYLDNGCTLAGDEFKQCAIGDDDTKKMLGEALLAEVYHHCNITCSNNVEITVKIESED